MSYQKFICEGRLGRDPELRQTAGGTAIANFSVAVDGRPTKDGEKTTEWFNVKAFNKTAEIAAQYLQKGNRVIVDGHFQTETWEKDGEQKSKLVLIADRISFIDYNNGEEQEQREERPAQRRQQTQRPQQGKPAQRTSGKPAARSGDDFRPDPSEDQGFDDDIPF